MFDLGHFPTYLSIMKTYSYIDDYVKFKCKNERIIPTYRYFIQLVR